MLTSHHIADTSVYIKKKIHTQKKRKGKSNPEVLKNLYELSGSENRAQTPPKGTDDTFFSGSLKNLFCNAFKVNVIYVKYHYKLLIFFRRLLPPTPLDVFLFSFFSRQMVMLVFFWSGFGGIKSIVLFVCSISCVDEVDNAVVWCCLLPRCFAYECPSVE